MSEGARFALLLDVELPFLVKNYLSFNLLNFAFSISRRGCLSGANGFVPIRTGRFCGTLNAFLRQLLSVSEAVATLG